MAKWKVVLKSGKEYICDSKPFAERMAKTMPDVVTIKQVKEKSRKGEKKEEPIERYGRKFKSKADLEKYIISRIQSWRPIIEHAREKNVTKFVKYQDFWKKELEKLRAGQIP